MPKLNKRKPIESSERWARPEGLLPLTFDLLRARGVHDEASYKAYTETEPGELWKLLRDPFNLNGMPEAVDIILSAVRNGQRICVYGDYDTDGICASAIVKLYLDSIGAQDTLVYLPSRLAEGYGLNEDAIDDISGKGYKLLVTVDTGITAGGLVEYAVSKGMRVVVTDHHRPDDNTPKTQGVPLVDPLINTGNYGFGYLCGAGVAFQLVTALAAGTPERLPEGREKVKEYVDFAALATIADIVSLTDENRAIAKLGLIRMNECMRPGLKLLIETAGINIPKLDAASVAFKLSPRINASGRMDDAHLAFDLLTCGNENICRELAEKLNQLNTLRRSEEDKVMQAADRLLEHYDFDNNRVVIIEGEDWHKGVIGLASSRITDRYSRPAVVLTRDGDSYIGSCRSLGELDIQKALVSVGDLLERFGGHKLAAGLKLKQENLASFKARLQDYFRREYTDADTEEVLEYDAEVPASWVTQELINQLEVLEPTGCDNPPPLLMLKGGPEKVASVGSSQMTHLKFDMRDRQGSVLPCIWYRNGDKKNDAVRMKRAQILFAPKLNTWLGKTSVQAEVQYLMPETPDARILAMADELPEYEELLGIWYACQENEGLHAASMDELVNRIQSVRNEPSHVEAMLKRLGKKHPDMDADALRLLITGINTPGSCELGILVLKAADQVVLNSDNRLNVFRNKVPPLETELYLRLQAEKTSGRA